jgi:hypothetical protein
MNNMPVLLLQKVNHNGVKGSGAFHAILSELMPYGSTTNKQVIMTNLEAAYEKFGKPEVWAVAKAWLKTLDDTLP